MQNLYVFLLIVVFSSQLSAQALNEPMLDSILIDVQHRQTNYSKMAMTSLTGWAAGNMISGGIMMSNTSGQEKYFHQMNLCWNIVNLGIGIPGLIGTFKDKQMSFEETFKYQKKLENIYMFNAGLDVAYVATGWGLNNFGKTKEGEIGDRLKGYGNSLVLQGTYLFIHDIIMIAFYKSNNKRLDVIWKNVTIQPTGLGVRINFN